MHCAPSAPHEFVARLASLWSRRSTVAVMPDALLRVGLALAPFANGSNGVQSAKKHHRQPFELPPMRLPLHQPDASARDPSLTRRAGAAPAGVSMKVWPVVRS